MFKIFLILLISVFVIYPQNNSEPGNYSIQINAGIISPRSSANGPAGAVQLNYPVNELLYLYAYTGISKWDRNQVVFHNDRTETSNLSKQYYHSYSEDDHTLIPFYLGSLFNVHSTDLFSTYVTIEIGYSFLSYNSYENVRVENPETGEVLSYYGDDSTKKSESENLFGVGIGAGISHSVSGIIDLSLNIKLNSYLNDNYNGLFSTGGTYTTFLAGVNINI